MKIQLDRKAEGAKDLEVNHLRVIVDENTEFQVEVNKFGELEITKIYFGDNSGSISVEPCVSNKIKLK